MAKQAVQKSLEEIEEGGNFQSYIEKLKTQNE